MKIKKNKINPNITLDAEHNKKINVFKANSKNLVKYKELLEYKINEYSKLNEQSSSELGDELLEYKMTLMDEIKELKNKINDISKNISLNKYLLDTSHLLYNYYDVKKNVTEKSNSSVIDFFKQNSLETKIHLKDNKNEIINKYLSKVNIYRDKPNNENINVLEDYICKLCSNEMIILQSEGLKICQECKSQEKFLIDSDKPSYKDPPRELSYFAYKRINHFNEWLAQFQAKETTDISNDVYKLIKKELKKEKYINIQKIKVSKIRDILKKLGLNKYYEHAPHIINRLSGIPPPRINKLTEDKLRRMFIDIQPHWLTHCPNNRNNFLSYSYVLYKSLQLLELDDLLEHFSLLKSREKLAEQDVIWKKICNELQWEFIKTI